MSAIKVQDPVFEKVISLMPPLNLETGPWIVGGAGRKLYQNSTWTGGDVDVFFRDDHQRREWTRRLLERNDDKLEDSGDLEDLFAVYTPKRKPQIIMTYYTDNAETWTLTVKHQETYHDVKIQLIKARMAPNLQAIWDGFDFTVCQFATDGSSIVATSEATQDLSANQLVVVDPKNSRCLPLRILKYYTYGFQVNDQLILWAAEQIKNGAIEWEDQY